MTALQHLRAGLTELRGVRRLLVAFAAGLVSALGFAPLQIFPALLLGFAVLVLLLDGADNSPHPLRSAFGIGWAFGFGQHLLGLYWIGYAFMVDPSAHLWQLPFAVTLLPAGLALFSGFACLMALYFWQDGAGRFLVFAVFYAAAEWLRGHVLTGFPWNLPAYGWGASLEILQSMSVIGAYGLSFLTVLLGASLAGLCGEKAWRAPLAMILLFICLWGFGAVRLGLHPTQNVSGISLRLVQPNIPQREKERAIFYARNWQLLLTLSTEPGNPNIIVWPEAAPPPFLFDREPMALDEIAVLTGQNRTLITGATRVQRTADNLSFYNSLFIFGPNAQKPQIYDKFHLVPFGEYVPFAHILNRIGITKLTDGQDGFASGDGPHAYTLQNAPLVTPLICYEIIFPAAVTAKARPGWFVNVTDDSWFGPWAGPYQHLLIARARAIEEAVPVARAANTGISAIIDPYGRVTARLGLGRMGVLDGRLPKAAAQSTYARYGDLLFAILLIAATLCAFVLRRA